ncbi:hypothetical protein [Rhizobium leguminosarum]|uniref:hypothetical protein n=1 Tax=Rhizobium leguminosarum TaxID=384 RepID=UPI0018DF1C67|nr:hypothetical protein [Rhizobium leguminosarum]
MYRADLPLFIPANRTEFGHDVQMNPEDYRWTSSVHMPRWASRILLEIVSVRVERLQDISERDVWAQGAEGWMDEFSNVEHCKAAKEVGACIDDIKPAFALHWERENGAGSWNANPWVWVVEFKRVDA